MPFVSKYFLTKKNNFYFSYSAIWLFVFLFPLAFQFFLINITPSIYSWDAFTRLWESRTLLLRHWLPLPQVPIFITSFLNIELFSLRCIYSFFSVSGAVIFGLYISRCWGDKIGISCAILVSFFPSFTMYSIVPYQEGFLIFFLGLFLLLWNEAIAIFNKNFQIASSFSILLAELCRYEAWVLAFIIFSGALIRRQWRLLPALIPALLFPLIWLFILNHLDFADGPPRNQQTLIGSSHDSNLLVMLSSNLIASVKSVIYYSSIELALIGFPFMLWGAVVSWKKGGMIGRELLFFLIFLFLLAVMRAAISGVLTSRMPLLFNVFAIMYLVIGWQSITWTLTKNSSNLFFFSILTTMFLGFIAKSYVTTKAQSLYFLPEAKAASLLTSLQEKISSKMNVVIIPRIIPNILDESAIGAIFANSMKIDHRDRKWIYQEKIISKLNLDSFYVLRYDERKKQYELAKPR